MSGKELREPTVPYMRREADKPIYSCMCKDCHTWRKTMEGHHLVGYKVWQWERAWRDAKAESYLRHRREQRREVKSLRESFDRETHGLAIEILGNGQTMPDAPRTSTNSITLGMLSHPDVMDAMIEWRLSDPRFKSRSQLRRDKLQRQFTIELRVDYADAEKNETMKQALQAAARHVFATASLLADQVKPQIVLHSDDFFAGPESIELLPDTIKQGADLIGGAKDEGVSSELMAAVKT